MERQKFLSACAPRQTSCLGPEDGGEKKESKRCSRESHAVEKTARLPQLIEKKTKKNLVRER